ncbi:MAG TPA: hypothetical protein VGG33_23085, partial [Polyangia bacterium]
MFKIMQLHRLHMKLSRRLSFLIAGTILFCGAPLRAQQPPTSAAVQDSLRKLTQRLSPAQQEVLKRIQESGMSREQMRERLRAAGYDPTLADQYYDALAQRDSTAGAVRTSRITRPLPRPSGNFVEALRRIGILAAGDSLPPDPIERDSLVQRKRVQPESREPQIFGRELFAATTQFEATTAGPVDPDYRFGPGDEITLLVTGDVEA